MIILGGEPTTTTSADLRRIHLARALRVIHAADGQIGRAQLAGVLSCTRATAAALVADLEGLGLVSTEQAPPTGRRGRPTPLVRVDPEGPAIVVLEIGVDRVRLATATIGGTLSELAGTSITDRSPAAVTSLAARMLRRRLTALGARCAGVGIAVHGLVDRSSGVVRNAPHLGWTDVDLVAALSLPTALPCRVENVANLIAIADSARGVGHGCVTTLYIHSGIGVGGAFVHAGQPLLGRLGIAGEYGHLPLGNQGLPCRCGRRGCWETEVDQLAVVLLAGGVPEPASAEAAAREVFGRASRGDPTAATALESAATALGRGLAALVTVHDPDLVVLAGHAADLHIRATATVDRALTSHLLSPHRHRPPRVKPTPLGAEAALLGAAESLFARLLDDPTSLAQHSGRTDAPS